MVALAMYFIARAALAYRTKTWEADFHTLGDGETEVFISKGGEQITYASIAPIENYEEAGKTELDRRLSIEIALEDAEAWAKQRNR